MNISFGCQRSFNPAIEYDTAIRAERADYRRIPADIRLAVLRRRIRFIVFQLQDLLADRLNKRSTLLT